MSETPDQIERKVEAAHESSVAATWTTNGLVGRTLETAVSGKESATTLHHAYSAQFLVARVLDWAKEWVQAVGDGSSHSLLPRLDDWLTWMQRARSHAEILCRCFPTSEKDVDATPKVAEWAQRWPQGYFEAKGHAEAALRKIEIAIEAIERQQQMEKTGNNQ
jgi:hypothetical protein